MYSEILTGAINHSRGVLHGSNKKITPVGYFTGAIKNHSCGVSPQELYCMVKMRYFRVTGMIFPRLALHQIEFEGIWRHYFAIGCE
jgi:hypothetical protein